MSLSSYPHYRSSGVEWLGEVPEHWETRPFFCVGKERQEPNKGMIENNRLSLSYGRIVRRDINSNDGLLPESFETYQVVRPGNIVFRLTDLQNDKRSLRTAIVNELGIITSAYLAVEPVGVDPYFFNYLLRAYDLIKVFYSMGGGLRQSIKYSDIKRMPVIIPPLGEQKNIVAFLDREIAKIDALIAEQQTLIDCLQEKRLSTINYIISKGLNPKIKLKESTDIWLGQIPEHWKELPLKRVARIDNSGTWGDEANVLEIDLPVATTAQIDRDGNFDISSMPIRSFSFDDAKQYLCNLGDILVVKSSGSATNIISGKAGIIREQSDRFIFSNFLMRIIADRNLILPELLFFILTSNLTRERVKIAVSTTTYPNLKVEEYLSAVIPIPPIEEQIIISEQLLKIVRDLDRLVIEAESSISLLQEHRFALISATVMGKVDVRGVVKEHA
jgi:type I restriction enzyme S subunit